MKRTVIAVAAAVSLWGFFGPDSKEKPLLQKLEESSQHRANLVDEAMRLTFR